MAMVIVSVTDVSILVKKEFIFGQQHTEKRVKLGTCLNCPSAYRYIIRVLICQRECNFGYLNNPDIICGTEHSGGVLQEVILLFRLWTLLSWPCRNTYPFKQIFKHVLRLCPEEPFRRCSSVTALHKKIVNCSQSCQLTIASSISENLFSRDEVTSSALLGIPVSRS